MRDSLYHLLNFDIDRYLNPWIPHNRLGYFPKPLQHFLGLREQPQKEPPTALQWPITFLSTVAGLCLVAGVYNYAPGIAALHPPVIIASLGASAILDYNAVRSPLAQPRNAILGHTFSAICGIAVSKLFQLSPNYHEITWVSGAVGCALASLVMSITNTVHPPGGATAVLTSTEVQIVAMGWTFIPVVLLGTLLMLAVALIFNNIMRQYPIYWWTPADVGRKLRHDTKEQDAEAQTQDKLARVESETSSERTLHQELRHMSIVDGIEMVKISPYQIELPSHLQLSDDEVVLLEHLQNRLQTHGEVG